MLMARESSETPLFVTLLAKQGYEGKRINMWALRSFREHHSSYKKSQNGDMFYSAPRSSPGAE